MTAPSLRQVTTLKLLLLPHRGAVDEHGGSAGEGGGGGGAGAEVAAALRELHHAVLRVQDDVAHLRAAAAADSNAARRRRRERRAPGAGGPPSSGSDSCGDGARRRAVAAADSGEAGGGQWVFPQAGGGATREDALRVLSQAPARPVLAEHGAMRAAVSLRGGSGGGSGEGEGGSSGGHAAMATSHQRWRQPSPLLLESGESGGGTHSDGEAAPGTAQENGRGCDDGAGAGGGVAAVAWPAPRSGGLLPPAARAQNWKLPPPPPPPPLPPPLLPPPPQVNGAAAAGIGLPDWRVKGSVGGAQATGGAEVVFCLASTGGLVGGP